MSDPKMTRKRSRVELKNQSNPRRLNLPVIVPAQVKLDNLPQIHIPRMPAGNVADAHIELPSALSPFVLLGWAQEHLNVWGEQGAWGRQGFPPLLEAAETCVKL